MEDQIIPVQSEEADDSQGFVFGPEALRRLKRIQAKIGEEEGEKPPLKAVLGAALIHLEWKIDREAEGLRIAAVTEDMIEDDDEPWK